jgi:phytoene desaturase
LSLVPNLDGRINWETLKEEYTERVLAFLEEHYLPGLRAHLVVKHTVTPHHFQQTLNSYKGAAFSIKPSMMQSGYFRPQVVSRHFRSLYFVGAGVHPGAGVPAVMASGKIAAGFIDPS